MITLFYHFVYNTSPPLYLAIMSLFIELYLLIKLFKHRSVYFKK